MSTTTIDRRPSNTTTVDRLAFEPADFAVLRDAGQESRATQAPDTLRFEYEVSNFQRTVGRQREVVRSAIVKKIVASDAPDEYIQTVIDTLLSSGRPGRLDDAIDILAETGRVLPQFILETLAQQQGTEADEDYWYVLIRAVGKSKLPSARMLIQLLWSRSPEAAVEALRDMGDDDSIKRLRAIATSEPSEFIRQMAAEFIEECSE